MHYNITRTELVWPGKYDENGKRREVDRVSLPFQVIERVNESRATREAHKARGLTLFDLWEGDTAETFEDGWRNKLIWGENKLVMSSLLDQFAGKVDLIYIDPPFATGADFSVTVDIGETGEELYKEQSLIEEKAYRDTWGSGLSGYLAMISERLGLARELLAPNGTLYVHVDYRVDSHVRVILDELFGRDALRNEIVWHYKHMSNVQRDFARKHDILLRYCPGDGFTFNMDAVREAYDEKTLKRYEKDVVFPGGYRATANPLGKIPDDVWVIPPLRNVSNENVGFPTQKPEELLSRVVSASSNPGDLVADFFCGSGTTQVVSEKLGRRWIGADLGRYAIHTSRKRLLGIPGCKPFEVLNLGRYERKYWQVATFGEDLAEDGVISLYEYIAFILKLYGASPTAGLQHLHGKKGRAFIHVGAVDSPVTIDEIASCVEECLALKAKELHVLGWEWEMGLHDPMAEEAAARGVQLLLRQIPREVMEEQAAAKGDVQFFELAYLDVQVKPTRRKLEVVADLKGFVIPNPELVPDEVREKIRKWSDYVDYWAVDWNFSDDTFHQGWVTYRTRKDRTLDLKSDSHVYDAPGEYAVMVKVIDIFGNDTSKICHVKVG
jgi:adenine-specific DNA-methyltransferase